MSGSMNEGTMHVELLKENDDGSADYVFHMTDEQREALLRYGIMKAIEAGIEEARLKYTPSDTDNYEVNHLCGCRACSNIAHLECIPSEEHTVKTNRERNVNVQLQMIELIQQGLSVQQMMEITGRSRDSIYQYRSRYNKNKLPVLLQH